MAKQIDIKYTNKQQQEIKDKLMEEEKKLFYSFAKKYDVDVSDIRDLQNSYSSPNTNKKFQKDIVNQSTSILSYILDMAVLNRSKEFTQSEVKQYAHFNDGQPSNTTRKTIFKLFVDAYILDKFGERKSVTYKISEYFDIKISDSYTKRYNLANFISIMLFSVNTEYAFDEMYSDKLLPIVAKSEVFQFITTQNLQVKEVVSSAIINNKDGFSLLSLIQLQQLGTRFNILINSNNSEFEISNTVLESMFFTENNLHLVFENITIAINDLSDIKTISSIQIKDGMHYINDLENLLIENSLHDDILIKTLKNGLPI
ncbi:MAG: hypothetical protein U9N59_06085 [Campylobacterota bacterium]|nr:hypothetical protein [Campylobacterota bacterium]